MIHACRGQKSEANFRRYIITDPITQEHPAQQLESAFNLFNTLSVRLEEAYGDLEAKVAALEIELREARLEREAQRVEKERIADRLAGLLAELPAGVILVGSAGLVEQANRTALDMLDEPLVGEALDRVLERSLTASTDLAELVTQGGRRLTLTRRELEDASCIIVLTDVTEVHDLQRRVARNQRLSEMGEMAARLAHQIRTPVASAMLYASRLTGTGTEDSRRGAQKILERLRHLEATVNDMLVFAKGGGSQRRPLTLQDLMCQTLHSLDPRVAAKVSLAPPLNPPETSILGNLKTLAGALGNLATNAVECGADQVTLGVRSAVSGDVDIYVADNGPGVSPELAHKIFDPFFTTRSSGTGLGLAVVRSEAESMGGTVAVETNEFGGATFVIRVPVTEAFVADDCVVELLEARA